QRGRGVLTLLVRSALSPLRDILWHVSSSFLFFIGHECFGESVHTVGGYVSQEPKDTDPSVPGVVYQGGVVQLAQTLGRIRSVFRKNPRTGPSPAGPVGPTTSVPERSAEPSHSRPHNTGTAARAARTPTPTRPRAGPKERTPTGSRTATGSGVGWTGT